MDALKQAAIKAKAALTELSCHWAFRDNAPEFNEGGIGYEASDALRRALVEADGQLGKLLDPFGPEVAHELRFTFEPAQKAADLLLDIAVTPHFGASFDWWQGIRARAIEVRRAWKDSQAKPHQIARARKLLGDEETHGVSLDTYGACISEAEDRGDEGGYWVSAWVWVDGDTTKDGDVLDDENFDGNDDHIAALKDRVRELRSALDQGDKPGPT